MAPALTISILLILVVRNAECPADDTPSSPKQTARDIAATGVADDPGRDTPTIQNTLESHQ